MLVSEYFRHLRHVIDACEAITAKEIVDTEHFPDSLNLPHHKHTPKNVIATSAPTLEEVLNEIMFLKR